MAFLIGWPAVVLALIFSAFGILYRMAGPLVGAAIVLTPFSLYLAATPRFPWCVGLPLIPLLAAFALRKGRRNLAILLTALWFGFFAWLLFALHQARNQPQPAPPPVATDAEFTFSSDPTSEIAYVHYRGGLSGDKWTYQLFGDGRLLRTHSWAPGEFNEKEADLDSEQIKSLLRLAVEGGVMAWDWEQIQQRIIDSAGSVPRMTDPGSVEVRITLKSYSSSPPTRFGPVTKGIAISNLGLMRHKLPHISEIVALHDFCSTLSNYFHPTDG